MSESFLHYLWKFQYFRKEDLVTTDGDAVKIFSTGLHNTNAGPDFLNARIQIGDMQWVGNIEIHVRGSDWQAHKHQHDLAYENVVLHVVWNSPTPLLRRDGSSIPSLQLEGRVSDPLIFEYKKLINSFEYVPCAQQLEAVPSLLKVSTIDRALVHRLQHRAQDILQMLERNTGDWEETCYQLLARNFGFKVNGEPFLQLARMISYKTLLKHTDKPIQVEALLFGAAGFLEEHGDDEYYKLLQREFNLLRRKYRLLERSLHKMQWKFLRLRPSNFPTLRVAQFAALMTYKKNIFSVFTSATTIKALSTVFDSKPSVYWEKHYHFRKDVEHVPSLGADSIANILVNTVVPLCAAYAIARDDYSHMDRAIDLLHQLPAESNRITRQWDLLSMRSKSAFESQALIELYNNFCSRRRCLDCNIGGFLISPASVAYVDSHTSSPPGRAGLPDVQETT